MITISDFPELSTLQESDKIVLFVKNDDGFYPSVEPLSSFSNVLIEKSQFNVLSSNIMQLISNEKDIENELSNNYPTTKFISETYATTSLFVQITNAIKKTSDLMNDLNTKATKNYLDNKYQRVLFTMQDLKRILGSGGWSFGGEDGLGYKVALVSKAKGGGDEV